MNGEGIKYNGETKESTFNIIQAHPVLIVNIGTTTLELSPIIKAQVDGIGDIVPWRCICVDSMPYEDVVTRLTQNGWARKQIAEAIPRSHYFELTSPFTDNFDFDNPLNKPWNFTVFDPVLRRLATRPDGPGCAGTPALGRARVEGNEQELARFFRDHLDELCRLRTETLALKSGVIAFVVTTYRGGTGTGATMPGAAILRQAMDGGFIHLHASMPDAYGADERAYANAFAAALENQGCHQYEQGVAMKSGQTLKAPLDSAAYMFGRNGTVTLHPKDLLMQEASILMSYLKANTQSAISARLIDLTDVTPYDLDDKPMHVRIETAVSIQTMHPGVQDYLALEWVRKELTQVSSRFENWCQMKKLNSDEESRVKTAFESLLKDGNLSVSHLLTRIDPSPTPSNALRNYFERINGTIGSMRSDEIKQNMAGLPNEVCNAFIRYEENWKKAAGILAQKLPEEIVNLVMSRFAGAEHLALSTVEAIRLHFVESVTDLNGEVEAAKKIRAKAGTNLGQALSEVQGARSYIPLMKSDEVARDAAHKACGIALSAALARVEQQRREYLIEALAGQVSTFDNLGKSVTIPSIISALQQMELSKIAELRAHHTADQENLSGRLDGVAQAIEKRSPVFQRSLIYDRMNRTELDELVKDLRTRIPNAPPVIQFLQGKQGMEETLRDLLPHLPSYAYRNLSLEQILTSDAEKRKLVLYLLKNSKPFTPISREVEEQQNLRNRRDTLAILEIPGGQDSPLADLMLSEGITSNRNQIVDAKRDEIRLYYLRDGLPYSAIQPLIERYKDTHDRYTKSPSAVTPYTFADAHRFPGIEPPRVNLRLHTEQLLYTAKAVLEGRVMEKPSGGFNLLYQEETGYQFITAKEESYPDFNALVGWLAKRPQIRKALERDLRDSLDDNPSAYKNALIDAWHRAEGLEKERLQQMLFSLRIDPSKIEPLPTRKGSQQEHRRKSKNEKTRSVQ